MIAASRKKLAGVVRVALFFSVLAFAWCGWWTGHARAEAAHDGLRLGRELQPLADLLQGHHQISLNGEVLFLAQTTVAQSVPAVLDRVADHCRRHQGVTADLMDEIGRAERLRATDVSLSDLAIVRDEEDGEGIVLCLAKNGDTKPLDALRAFAETQDIGALGKVRYVYARPDGAGNTHVLAVVTEGSFRVDRLLTEAEGRIPEDIHEVPRPPESRFVFDARIRDTSYGVRIYRTKKSVAEVASFYDRALTAKGWDIASPPVPEGVSHGYSKEGGVHIVMGAFVDKESGDTLVSIAEIGAVASAKKEDAP